jgi:hypothetical protein
MALERNSGPNPMGKYTRVIGIKGQCMVKVSSHFVREKCISENSKMDSPTAAASESGKMETCMKEIMLMVSNKVSDYL